MGRPNRLCILCSLPVQETEQPYRTWKTHLIWSESVAICEDCVEYISKIPPAGDPPYWQLVSSDERA